MDKSAVIINSAYSYDKWNNHIHDYNNPHHVKLDNFNKADFGIAHIDDTADMDKPLSYPQQPIVEDMIDSALSEMQTSLINNVINVDVQNMITDALNIHIADNNNPHNVTKSQVGLGLVDNTPDMDKPVSTAQSNLIVTVKNEVVDLGNLNLNDIQELQTQINDYTTTIQALETKIDTHANSTDNPHDVTAEQVGLGNVTNVSDAEKFTYGYMMNPTGSVSS
jgi:hypothetical protein